ncbi:MAG: hypothetical protein ACO1OB_27400, partial [Archangium sp.]
APGVPTFYVPAGFTLQPGVATVIGASADPTLNDDAGVTLAWGASGFTLSQDAGTFSIGTADAGGAGFNYWGLEDGGRGSSLNVDPGPIVGTTGTPGLVTCASTTPYGFQTPPQLGTPGCNAGCGFPYTLKPIPVHYVDISDGGVVIGATADNGLGIATFGPDGGSPLPKLFGTPISRLSISANGYMLTSIETTGANENKVVASSTRAGSVAVFWDDLKAGVGGNTYWKLFEPGEDPLTPARHWIVQWKKYTYWTGGPDDMNFEAKLFEDGTVEYHFGVMTSGSSLNYANGNSATVWLENPAGTQALVVGASQPVIAPNTAYRFTPR